MTTPLTHNLLSLIAGLLDHHVPRPLDTAEMQLAVRYAILSDAEGRSAASIAELLDGLCARKRGMRASRKAITGGWRRKHAASPGPAARQRLEQHHRLLRVRKTLTRRRSRRTGALLAAPCDVTLMVPPGRPFSYRDSAGWLAALLCNTSMTSTARYVGLRLARALDQNGCLQTTRKQLVAISRVQQQRAMLGALDQLQACGLIYWSEDRTAKRPWPITIRATVPADVQQDTTDVAADEPAGNRAPAETPATEPPIDTAVTGSAAVGTTEPFGGELDLDDDRPFTGGGATEEEAELYRRLRGEEDVELPSPPMPHPATMSFDEYARLMAEAPWSQIARTSRPESAQVLIKPVDDQAPAPIRARPGESQATTVARSAALVDDPAPLETRATNAGADIASRETVLGEKSPPTLAVSVAGQETSGQLVLGAVDHEGGVADRRTRMERSAAADAAPAAAAASLVRKIRIAVEPHQLTPAWVNALRAICTGYPGEVPIRLALQDGRQVPLRTGPGGEFITVRPSSDFAAAINALKGDPIKPGC